MSKQQTAVDWLFNQLPDHLRLSRNGFDMLQQAKELESKQIIDAYILGHSFHDSNDETSAEQYYNNKYGQ